MTWSRNCAAIADVRCSIRQIPRWACCLQTNPHRVFISRIGRIEVYQPIPPASGKSPDGPHTHVLPKLLKSGRTHAATEPIPEGWIPCAHLYPAHPVRDGTRPESFDAASHESFQRMIERFGLPDGVAIKRRVMDAIKADEPPSDLAIAHDRHGRTNVRIALRQLKAAGMPRPYCTLGLRNSIIPLLAMTRMRPSSSTRTDCGATLRLQAFRLKRPQTAAFACGNMVSVTAEQPRQDSARRI